MELFTEGSDIDIKLQYRVSPGDPKIAERNRMAVMNALDELVTGNVDSFWSLFDPDVVFHEAACLPYGGAHTGLKAAKEALGRLSDMYSSNHVVFEEVLAAGDIVIAYQTMAFRVKANGNTGALPVAELYRFRNGKVVEWRALYFDSNMVAQLITEGRSNGRHRTE
jgi:ketosteroid isomerase-like protein